MGVRGANAILLVWILFVMFLGACKTPIEAPCDYNTGTLHVPNHGRVWRIEYEPAGFDGFKSRWKARRGRRSEAC